MHVVLVQPEIPQNTGNIARSCAATGAKLHLVRPLGFSVDDRQLKRAGLDYWHLVEVYYHDSFSQLEAKYPNARWHLATTKGGRFYSQVTYQMDDFLVFGSETRGLPPEMLAARPESCVRIPMREGSRSLNLSNAVAIVLFEALRQNGFPGLV